MLVSLDSRFSFSVSLAHKTGDGERRRVATGSTPPPGKTKAKLKALFFMGEISG